MASRAQTWQDSLKRRAIRSGAMVGAVALGFGALVLTLLLASYHPSDPSLNTSAAGPARNLIGAPGAWISDVALLLIGPASGLLIPLVIVAATRLWRGVSVQGWGQRALRALGGIALIDVALALFKAEAVSGLPGGLGGSLGYAGAGIVSWATSFIADSSIARAVTLGIAVLLAVAGIIVWAISLGLDEDERSWLFRRRMSDVDNGEPFPAPPVIKLPEPRPAPPPRNEDRKPIINLGSSKPPSALVPKKPAQSAFDLKDRYVLPSLELLKKAPPSTGPQIDKAGLERNARLLESVLDDFHVKGSIVEVRPGPVVTMYELEPAAGIKASRVVQLADDIARNMSAMSAQVCNHSGPQCYRHRIAECASRICRISRACVQSGI